MEKINVRNNLISIIGISDDDYISLIDIARIKNSKEPKDVVKNWMRLRSTLEFPGMWEDLNNPFTGSNSTPYCLKVARTLGIKAPIKERLILSNSEANREKELFNKNHIKPIYRIK